MTLNVPAASTPAPSGVVNNDSPPGAVNFDKFSAAPGSKRLNRPAGVAPKDTRVAQIAGGADTAAGAGVVVWGAAVVGGALLAMHELEQDTDGTRRYERQWAVAKDRAQQLSDGLKNLNNAAALVNVHIDVPSTESLQKGLMSLYEEAKRTGGNASQLADRFVQKITGQGGGASNMTAVPSATQPSRPAPSAAQPKASSRGASTQPARPVTPPANAAAQRQASASIAAANTLTQADTVAPSAYAAMEKFYQAASGGRAARAAGALNAPLQSVRQAYSQLGHIVATADKQMAAASPADRKGFVQRRNAVAQSRQAIGQWLPGAMAFSQGRSKPNGPAVANPTAPRPPAQVLEPTGRGKDVQGRLADGYTQAARQAGAASLTKSTAPTTAQRAQAAQQTSAAQPSATVTNQQPSQTAAAPNVKFVDKFPPSVKRVVPVWVNPVTGEASATAKTGKEWVRTRIGVAPSLAADTGSLGEPGAPSGAPGAGVTNNDNRTQTINFYAEPPPDGRDPKDPKWKKACAIAAKVIAGPGATFVGATFVRSAHLAEVDRNEKAWESTVLTRLEPFKVPPSYATADAKAQGLVTMWKSYLDQVPGLIEKNHVSDSKSEIASVKKEFAAQAAEFLQDLANDRDALKKTPDGGKASLLEAMANKKLSELSSTIKGTEQRPTRLLVALTKKLNDTVANSVSSIATRPITGDARAEKARASVNWKLGVDGKPFLPPPNASPVTTENPNGPEPAAAAAQAQAQAAQKIDEDKALKTVADAVKRANLKSPPSTAALSTMTFTTEMFIDKSQSGDTRAIKEAFDKGLRIQQACQAAESAATPRTRQQVVDTPGLTVTAVLNELNELMTAVNAGTGTKPVGPSAKPSLPPQRTGQPPKPVQ